MDFENRQAEQLLQNKDIRELIDLLKQNNPSQGKEYAALLGQVEEMSQMLGKALQELREVRTQLGGQKESGIKQAVTKAVEAVEGRISAMRMAVSDMKERIVREAREAVEGFKHGGTRALDMTVSLLGIRKVLAVMKNNLESSLQDVRKSIQTVEKAGHEMRSVGGHIRNAAYAITGKETLSVADRGEGHFQAAILAPLRRERDALGKLLGLVDSVIRKLEKLEQAARHPMAGRQREFATAEKKQDGTKENHQNGGQREKCQGEKVVEKPSVLKELRENQAKAAAHLAPMPGKENLSKGVAL
ncbi:MAG: hypothetical protein NC548_30500 [Lachnospiraceae bacterium]|nr:hypothetical protein [Acetatifactor muris]MCM1218837.1 hypothetical protein [Lachnospiraceae bacterium]